MKGKLYLIPTTLGENATETIPPYVVAIINSLDEFIAERAKTTRHFFKSIAIEKPLQALQVHELDKFNPLNGIEAMMQNALMGKSIGLLSEAGCPGVADPGAEVVAFAHRHSIEVVPLVGPSSILLALMASGMSGQQFAFVGYLPAKKPDRLKALKHLEQQAARLKQTQIFIETPYRNHALLEDAFAALAPNTRFCVAVDLTLPTQSVITQTIAQWRGFALGDLQKRPAIFLISGEN